MSEPETVPCYREPCDTFRRGGSHTVRDGQILHECHWGTEMERDPAGTSRDLRTAWSVRCIAWDDEKWVPYLYVRDQKRTFTSAQDAARLAEAVTTANRHALETNLDDARRELEATEAVVRDQDLELTRLEELLGIDA